MKRRYLTVVRAGDKSLHPAWLGDPARRTWDLVVSYYGDQPALYRESDVRRIDVKGGKWGGLHRTLLDHPDLVQGYDYVWFPDDDLACAPEAINAFFETCSSYRLELAQPSLTWDSYTSYLATLHNPRFRLRYTNFVEVMAPCLSAELLTRVLRTFDSTRTGWGLDLIWPRQVRDPRRGVAIVDSATVRHTRAVGGPLYASLKTAGGTPWDELREFYRANGLADPQRVETHAAITLSGSELVAERRRSRLVADLLFGPLPAMIRTPYRGFLARKLLRFAHDNLLGSGPVVEEVRLLPEKA